MRILIILITLITLALSASLAVARDSNRDALWLIEKQKQIAYQQWAGQAARPGGYWTGYQRSDVGTYPNIAPDAVRFFGN